MLNVLVSWQWWKLSSSLPFTPAWPRPPSSPRQTDARVSSWLTNASWSRSTIVTFTDDEFRLNFDCDHEFGFSHVSCLSIMDLYSISLRDSNSTSNLTHRNHVYQLFFGFAIFVIMTNYSYPIMHHAVWSWFSQCVWQLENVTCDVICCSPYV